VDWPEQAWEALEVYAHQTTRYHLTELDRVLKMTTAGYRLDGVFFPSYTMGDQFPSLRLLKRP
jgi:hypothetical protein